MCTASIAEPAPQVKPPGSVYQYYDASDVLLYVGATKRGATRNLEHASARDWWPFVTRQEVAHYPTYESALAAERRCIFDYRPPFNVAHNPDHRIMRQTYLDFLAPDQCPAATFQELYQKLEHRLTMRLFSHSPGDDVVSFATEPSHFIVAKTVVLAQPKSLLNNNVRVGNIHAAAIAGTMLFFRGTMKESEAPPEFVRIRLKVVQLKPPITTRIVSICCEAGADALGCAKQCLAHLEKRAGK